MTLKKACCILSLMLLFCIHAYSQNFPEFKAVAINKAFPELRSKFKKSTPVQIESSSLSLYARGKSAFDFKLNLGNEKNWDLQLQPSNIVTSNYKLKIQTETGLQTISSNPDFLYKGKVKGSSSGEEVRLAIKEGFIYGSIQNDGKEYFIEPLARFTKANSDEYIVYEAKDLIQTQNFSCGFNDRESTIETEKEEQKILEDPPPQSSVCKKIRFISVADYSIYQKFDSDVYAVETALLANLNLAAGAFINLNLGPDGSTDVGTDYLQFQMEEVVVSTCRECDINSLSESALDLAFEMNNWLSISHPNQGSTIMQLWTQRSLFEPAGRPIGGIAFNTVSCNRSARQIIRYLSDDPAFLRMLVAHETGHLLGCIHDDEVKQDVKGFIMDSHVSNATLSTRFSTLVDFKGGPYSSQKKIRDFINFQNCMSGCSNASCETIKDISTVYYNTSDSIGLKWNGSGNVVVKYKAYDSLEYLPDNVHEVSGNSITLRNLKPCTVYRAELQKKCSNTEFGSISSLVINTSSLMISGKPVNNYGSSYDLAIDISCKDCSSKEYFITIDKKAYTVLNNSGLNRIVIKNLFADGARHRIDVSKDSTNTACRSTAFYTAPYYRSNSINILGANFNSCDMPTGWEDSLLAKTIASAPTAEWLIGEKNFFSLSTARGNFDSTCMIYYNRYNSFGTMYSGALSLTSPSVDFTKYKNIKLHFDYNFLSNRVASSASYPSVTIDIYDSIGWVNVFKREAITVSPNDQTPRRNIWDSIPARVFIDLDKYKNKNFKFRLIADDGSFASNESGYLFAAFDNIVVDGYLKDSIVTNDFIVYPNPSRNEIFIKFSQQPLSDINYSFTDVTGRIMQKGKLNNYRIDLKGLSAGMYFLKLYSNENILKTVKLIHQP